MTQERAAKTEKMLEQSGFEQISKITQKKASHISFIDRLFSPLFASLHTSRGDWKMDARLAVQEQKVLRARGILYTMLLVLVALIVWAGLAEVDEVTRGEGKVIPSKQLQVVQSVDGGVVEEVFVAEGQAIKAGDLLARLDPTRFVANLQEGSVKVFALRAKVERLKALVANENYQPKVTEDITPEQAEVLAQEQSYYFESKRELEQRVANARDQHSQRQQELSEARARLSAASQSHQMLSQELSATRPLLNSGAVSEMEVLRLQREVAQALGERNQAAARSRQVEAGIQEALGRVKEVELGIRNQWRAELSEASSLLSSLDKNVDGLADRVKFAELRSPVNGTVQRVLVNTAGAVVQPGNPVVEIVPADDRLLIEAKIAPSDIAFLRPGLPATVKFHAYDYSIYGGLSASLTHISADTMTDERDNTYYLVRALTDKTTFSNDLSIIPGMTTQLDIMTGKKTILSYLLKPLLRAKANALTER